MTNVTKFNDFKQQLIGILNAIRVYETRAPTPQELEAERDTFLEDVAITRRWFDFFRNDPPDAQQKNELSAEINALVPALGGLARHAGTQGHSLERILSNFIASLRQIEAIPATGAGGAGTPAVQTEEVIEIKELENFLQKDFATFLAERQDAMTMAQQFKRTEADVSNLIKKEQILAILLSRIRTDLNNTIQAIKHRDFGIAFPAINDAFKKIGELAVQEGLVRGEIQNLKAIFTEDEKLNNQLAQREQQIEAITSNMRRLTNQLRQQLLTAQIAYVR